MYTPELNFNGTDVFTYRAFDGSEYSESADVVITVYPVNDVPELSFIGAQSTDEDVTLTLVLSAEDVDGDALTYTAETAELNLTVKVTDDLLVMTPEVNWNGSADVTVTVSDGFLSDSETFTLTVIPVNDAPVAEDAAIFPSVPLETDDLSLSYVYTDLEDDPESGTEISWYMNGVEQGSFAGMLFIPSDATSCDEQWYAVVTPSDGIDVGESVESNSVTICGTNSPPEWSDIEAQHILEDSGDNEVSMENFVSDEEQALIQMLSLIHI